MFEMAVLWGAEAYSRFLLSIKRGSHCCYGFFRKVVPRPQVELRVPLPNEHIEAGDGFPAAAAASSRKRVWNGV